MPGIQSLVITMGEPHGSTPPWSSAILWCSNAVAPGLFVTFNCIFIKKNFSLIVWSIVQLAIAKRVGVLAKDLP